jgi:ABC-type transport system substrate-binding protein
MHRIFRNPHGWSAIVLILALILLVACGTAAPAEPVQEAMDEPSAGAPVETELMAEPAAESPAESPAEVPGEVPEVVPEEVPKAILENPSVTATPVPVAPAEVVEARVDRVIYGFGELVETNRWWTVTRPSYYQYDPWAETLLDLEPTTNARIPRVAESWEMNEDGSSWTFHLVEGIPFHGGYGMLTADDVKASAELQLLPDVVNGTGTYFGELLDEIEVVDDHTITFHLNGSSLLMPDVASRGFGGGDIFLGSQQQLDEGFESIDEKPVGTGSYQYGGRQLGEGIWFERVEGDHWRGERPDFKEVEIRFMREEASRLAALLTGEIHIASLSRELQVEAIKQGMQNIGAQVPTNYLVLFLSGQYYSAGDQAYDPDLPWAGVDGRGKLVRQAMNKAINRQEMQDFILRGSGKPMYNTAFHPSLEGWNPQWVADWEELYGYDQAEAIDLMRQAGFGPENPMDFTIWNYVSSDEPETSVMVEALINYWEPIGINVKLVDTEWGTIQQYYRNKTPQIKQGGWGNIITMRSLVDRVRAWQSTGNSRNWETALIDENWAKIAQTIDPDQIDQLIREIGDERFYNFADIPFFWFDLEVTVNPEVVADWTYPGTAGSKTSHWNLLRAAQ